MANYPDQCFQLGNFTPQNPYEIHPPTPQKKSTPQPPKWGA